MLLDFLMKYRQHLVNFSLRISIFTKNKQMRYILLFLALLLFSSGVFAQNYFNQTYNFGDMDHPLAIVTDSSENIYVCGWFEDVNQAVPHAFVLKTDADGQELWRVTLADTSKYFALCVTHTGSLALAGSKNNHCFLSLLNTGDGSELWTREEVGYENFWFATVDEVLDSTGYFFFVRKEINGAHKIRYELINPSNGNLIYEHIDINTIGGVAYTSGLMTPEKVWTAGDLDDYSGLVLGKNYNGVGNLGFYWDFKSSHVAGVHRYSAKRGSVVRYYVWYDGTKWLAVLTMLNDGGDVWGNSFEIVHDTFNVAGSGKYENGKFVVTGTIDNELALWFIDHDLTYMEEKTIATATPRAGVDVVCLPSLDMILMGTEQPDSTNNNTNVFLMKLDSTGLVSTPEHQQQQTISVYPNPAANQLYIKSNGQRLNHAKAYIVNSMGQTVKTVVNLNRPIDLSNLTKGLYVVVVYNNNKLVSQQKFIKK